MPQEIVAVAYESPQGADALLPHLAHLEEEHDVSLSDAVVVTRDARGRVRLNQTMDIGAGRGAAWGGLFGLLIGLVFLAPVGGALLGIGVGALVARLTDSGLDDRWLREVGESIPPEGSGLFLLVDTAGTDAVLDEVRRHAGEGKVLHTTMSDEAARAFEEALTKAES